MKKAIKQKSIPCRKHIPEIYGEKEFYSAIKKAMKKSDHKEGLQNIVLEFEGYKKFMSENLVPTDVPSDEIYTFRMTYQQKKNVWREFDILGDDFLETLAENTIDSMGFQNDHLHAFFFPEKREGRKSLWYTNYEISASGVDNDQYPIHYDSNVLVGNIDYAKNPKLGFVFDFGDDHRFLVEYKGKRKATEKEKDDDIMFPKLIDQRGVGPEQYPDYFGEKPTIIQL